MASIEGLKRITEEISRRQRGSGGRRDPAALNDVLTSEPAQPQPATPLTQEALDAAVDGLFKTIQKADTSLTLANIVFQYAEDADEKAALARIAALFSPDKPFTYQMKLTLVMADTGIVQTTSLRKILCILMTLVADERQQNGAWKQVRLSMFGKSRDRVAADREELVELLAHVFDGMCLQPFQDDTTGLTQWVMYYVDTTKPNTSQLLPLRRPKGASRWLCGQFTDGAWHPAVKTKGFRWESKPVGFSRRVTMHEVIPWSVHNLVLTVLKPSSS